MQAHLFQSICPHFLTIAHNYIMQILLPLNLFLKPGSNQHLSKQKLTPSSLHILASSL